MPTIEKTREYHGLKSIVMHSGKQLLSVEWAGGAWETYCFHRPRKCEQVAEVLHSMSHEDMAKRVRVERSAQK